MKYVIGALAVILIFSSCSICGFLIKGACETKDVNSIDSSIVLYDCEECAKSSCNPYDSTEEVYFHEGLSCYDIGYTYNTGYGVYYSGSEWEDYKTPGSGGYFADEAGTDSSVSYCTDTYQGPTSDIQRDSFCQAAYAYLCMDGFAPDSEEVTSQCDIYNSTSWGYTGNCPYCPK